MPLTKGARPARRSHVDGRTDGKSASSCWLMWILVSSPAFAPVYDRRFFLRRKALGTALQSDDGAYLIVGTVIWLQTETALTGNGTMPNEFCEVAEMIEPASSTMAAEPSRSSLMQHYEAIAQSSCAMLAAARAGDWIEVERQEERCAALIAILKAADEHSSSLSAADDQRRMFLLRQILADDAGIRGQAEPWLEPIVPLISTPRPRSNNGFE